MDTLPAKTSASWETGVSHSGVTRPLHPPTPPMLTRPSHAHQSRTRRSAHRSLTHHLPHERLFHIHLLLPLRFPTPLVLRSPRLLPSLLLFPPRADRPCSAGWRLTRSPPAPCLVLAARQRLRQRQRRPPPASSQRPRRSGLKSRSTTLSPCGRGTLWWRRAPSAATTSWTCASSAKPTRRRPRAPSALWRGGCATTVR